LLEASGSNTHTFGRHSRAKLEEQPETPIGEVEDEDFGEAELAREE